ncbi:hypothetical protein WR25_02062 isoform C [Diploscapter pachys]|uniref:SANT domain-containing protein n=1 Tax=Diploscapter pachys TaxID=2018661 RepID=A0A2A2LL05_9BILA|nr:hypothetical protein WR25_02062 isoform A [Diploscapter pachys]PAV86882.1 hypothetical protein WR25_02062 isoform B [Diploscapter pachys]PAV86883.1 hypothetical protein WR25_02062 isoform C [Diploscapter pachys]
MDDFPQVSHVIFDFDGLLVETESAYTKANTQLLSKFGKQFTMEIKRRQMGMKNDEAVKWLINEVGINDLVSPEEYMREYDAILDELFPKSAAQPGAERLVRHFIQNEIPTAICTGSCSRTFVPKAKSHRDWVDLIPIHVLTGDDPHIKRGKPFPDPYLETIKRFPNPPLDPSKCLVFEDAPNGVRSAISAGMHCIYVPDPVIGVDEELLSTKMDPTDGRPKPQISRRTMAFRPQNVVGKKLGPITSTPAKPFPKPDYRMLGPSTPIPPEVLAKKFKPRPNSMEALIAASSSVLMASTSPSAKTTAGTSRTSMVNGNLLVSMVRSESPLFEDVKMSSVARVDSPVPDDGATVPDQNPALFSPGSSDASNLNPEKKPKVRPWTFEESMTYYECLKIHGKDFDQVMKALEKRNFPCDKTKLKNYYFNTHKLLRQQLQLDEKDMEPLSKDARELFTMINHFEYKKRTNNAKMMPEKMKQLIFQGTTSVKIQKKAVVIKTPSCPCLMKLFQGVRFYDKIPSSVTVIMRPLTYSDANFVRSAHQNPFLKLKLGINDSIDRIFKLLELKWGQNSNPTLSLETRTPQIKLFTARKTEIGRLVPVEGDFSPAVAMSLNKLKRDCLEREKLKQAADGNSVSISAHPTYSVIYPNPFILTEKIFEEGLDKENVKRAVIAELFCTCGMTENIELCYSVKSSSEPTEALTVLLSLLKRDYGDALVKNDLINNMESGNAGSVTKKKWTNELEAEGLVDLLLHLIFHLFEAKNHFYKDSKTYKESSFFTNVLI